MASDLHRVGLDIASAVGQGAAAEFGAYVALYANLPKLELILAGEGDRIPFPSEPSVRYATVVGLTIRAETADQAYAAFTWLTQKAEPEWVQLFATDMFRMMRQKGHMGALAVLVQKDEKLRQFLKEFQQLVGL